MPPWTADDLPSQAGKTILVTGANSGVGYHAALELARKGASVILACRNPQKAAEALARIKAEAPDAKVELADLDLASLKSVRAFGASFSSSGRTLDVLLNNAGIMAPLTRKVSEDGLELQFQTNHLGHFLLTSLLVPALKRSKAPRVVNVTSIAHRRGRMDFDDLQCERSYSPWASYGATKLANLLFTFELQRRADTAGWKLLSLAAHPGVARTSILVNGIGGGKPTLLTRLIGVVQPLFTQTEEQGALPLIYAAGMEGLPPGTYYGSDGWGERTGFPARVDCRPQAKDEAAAARLWEMSEKLAGNSFTLG